MGTDTPESTEPAATPDTAAATRPREWPIEVRPNGTVIFDGVAIGGLDLVDHDIEGKGYEGMEVPRLTLNLGWMRAAGVHLTVEADPRVDRQRNGLVLER